MSVKITGPAKITGPTKIIAEAGTGLHWSTPVNAVAYDNTGAFGNFVYGGQQINYQGQTGSLVGTAGYSTPWADTPIFYGGGNDIGQRIGIQNPSNGSAILVDYSWIFYTPVTNQSWSFSATSQAGLPTCIAADSNNFMIGSESGIVVVTTSMSTATYRTGPTFSTFSRIYSVATNGTGRWIVGGVAGQAAYSDDAGATWTSLTSEFTSISWGGGAIESLGWNGSVFIAMSSSGANATSTDGATWTLQAQLPFVSGVWNSTAAVTSVGSTFIAADAEGRIARSTNNGVSWTYATTSPFDSPLWSNGNTSNFAVGSANVLVTGNLNVPGVLASSNDTGDTWVVNTLA